MRKLLWNMAQKLSNDYVESVHWWGYRTTQPLGLGFHGVRYHTWLGNVFYSFVE